MPERLPNPNNQPVELNRTSLYLGLLLFSFSVYCFPVISLTNRKNCAEHNIFKTGTVAVSLNVDRLIDLLFKEEKKLCLEWKNSPVGHRYDCRTGCNRCCWNFLYGSHIWAPLYNRDHYLDC